jgi:peptidoglycan/xylan/chitin deacetylase (PgdA/CDA1 family)
MTSFGFWVQKLVLLVVVVSSVPIIVTQAFSSSKGDHRRPPLTQVFNHHKEEVPIIEAIVINSSKIMNMKVTTTLLRSVWNLATWIGMRRLGPILKRSYPSAYRDTIFCWEGTAEVQGYMALTIDDGLCRNDDVSCSMVQEVRELLRSYNAHATFFVCTDYTTPQVVEEEVLGDLLQDGHELGNHLREDRSGYYCHLEKEDFRKELLRANGILQKRNIAGVSPKWFRAPQGRMSRAMCEVLQEEGMVHVLGDCYCDDWAFAEDGDTKAVAPLMLNQVQPGGSIAIFHMPERGFREASLQAMKEFLDGTKERNLRCVSLTEMEARAKSGTTVEVQESCRRCDSAWFRI